ncbi:conserved hypothetical protein [Gammaproteobacteria bacterium]
MPIIEETLAMWQNSLCPEVDVRSLCNRNSIAHKWKAPFRSLVLREIVFWRIHDLLGQSYELHISHHALGARILLRSALETLAILIYLNQTISAVLDGTQNFHQYSDKTSCLLLGSKNKSTGHDAINIITVFQKCEKAYAGITELYSSLSESAHPNFEGMCFGYSRINQQDFVSELSNNMSMMYEDSLESEIALCMSIFDHEYNIEWPRQFERLEAWIVENDEMLETTNSTLLT